MTAFFGFKSITKSITLSFLSIRFWIQAFDINNFDGKNAFNLGSQLIEFPAGIHLLEPKDLNNTTAIIGARTGKNPTMKTLERGFGINIGWNNERILSGDYDLIHTSTKHMIADIYTKCMANTDESSLTPKLRMANLVLMSQDWHSWIRPQKQRSASMRIFSTIIIEWQWQETPRSEQISESQSR